MQSPGPLRDADDNWDINSTTSEDIGYYGGYGAFQFSSSYDLFVLDKAYNMTNLLDKQLRF